MVQGPLIGKRLALLISMATPKLLSDELASRRGRVAAKTTTQPPPSEKSTALVPSGKPSDMVKIGPGAIGTSGAFQFGCPGCGTIKLRVLGTGNTVTLRFSESGSAYALNAGSVLTSGAFFEFEFAVDNGETLFVSGTSLVEVTAFWRPY